MQAERDRGIDDQPQPTCPMIDDAIDDLDEQIGYELQGILDEDDPSDNTTSRVKDAISKARTVMDQLEDIRDNAARIRQWGQGWKDHALENDDSEEVDDLRRKIADLEDQIDSLETERDDAIKERDEAFAEMQDYDEAAEDAYIEELRNAV